MSEVSDRHIRMADLLAQGVALGQVYLMPVKRKDGSDAVLICVMGDAPVPGMPDKTMVDILPIAVMLDSLEEFETPEGMSHIRPGLG